MAFMDVYQILVPTLTLGALLYAGIKDLLYREVRREIIWVLMAGIGIILDILYIINFEGDNSYFEPLANVLLTITVGFIFGFILFYLGVWGGADTKALWAISILSPVHPLKKNILDISVASIPIIDTSIFSILLNSGIIALFYPIVLMIINTITSTRGSLFDEVRGSSSEKIRCFLFGFRKKVDKINVEKLHYDFMEELINQSFKGKFNGDFEGRLDGTFTGIFQGKMNGEFTGTITGKFLLELDKPIDEQDVKEILTKAKEISKKLEIEKSDDDEVIDHVLIKYKKTFSTTESEKSEIKSRNSMISYTGQYTGPLDGIFIGTITGIFEGSFDGELLGELEGDYVGTSKKGKINGTKKSPPGEWRLKICMGLDEEEVMEKRQFRTIWQLKIHDKKTVWVTPGLPFVFLMLFGYVMFLLFNNLALLLFSL